IEPLMRQSVTSPKPFSSLTIRSCWDMWKLLHALLLHESCPSLPRIHDMRLAVALSPMGLTGKTSIVEVQSTWTASFVATNQQICQSNNLRNLRSFSI